MSIKITHKTVGRKESQLLMDNLDTHKKNRQEFDSIGLEVLNVMKQKINQSVKRPGSTKKLEDSINIDYFKDGWGVGRIASLVPYWAAHNWGSGHMIGKRVPSGEFRPGNPEPNTNDFRAGRWHKGGKFSFIVKNPIPATNYIERTAEWLVSRIKRFVSK